MIGDNVKVKDPVAIEFIEFEVVLSAGGGVELVCNLPLSIELSPDWREPE